MLLFLVFIAEYLLGEIAYQVFDGWIYVLGDWRDFNHVYYYSVMFIDLVVASYLLSIKPKTIEIAYAALATLSIFVNAGGLYVYISDMSDNFYLSVIRTILVLKLMLVLNRTLTHARIYAGDIADRVFSSLANSLLCIYVWEVVKVNQTKGQTW